MKRLVWLLIAAFLGALVLPARPVMAEPFGGVEFPQGAGSFADVVAAYSPAIVNNQPTAEYRDASLALGAPDHVAGAIDFVSLGSGGTLTLQFMDNRLTGSGDSGPDLWIFEIGPDVEDTFVEISRDGGSWNAVGKVSGSTRGIDIDAFGFGPSDLFSQVRVRDDPNEGDRSGASVGADIDAVGAISTVVNNAPTANDDVSSVAQDTSVVISPLANDTDPDGDVLALSTVDTASAAGGTVADNGDGTVTYTPPPGFSGSDSFTYSATDGALSGNVATVVVDVLPANHAPVASDDTAVTDQDTPVAIFVLANDTDPDGDAVSLLAIDPSSVEGGTVLDNGDGSVTYTPPPGFFGSDSFTYSATDGDVASNTATVWVDVLKVNQAPVAVDDDALTSRGVATTIDVLANDSDPDGDTVYLADVDGISAAGGAVVTNSNGSVTYTPPSGFAGTDNFSYAVTDGELASGRAVVSINVVNQAPDCTAAYPSVDAIWAPNGQFVAVDMLGITDPEGDSLTITVLSIFQDEPVGAGNGSSPDGRGIGSTTAEVRAERMGSQQESGNGRVYHITFEATDGYGGACQVVVTVGVPHDQGGKTELIDDGAIYDSTG